MRACLYWKTGWPTEPCPSDIRAKVWADGSPEPGNWSVVATDTAITGTGVLQIAHSHTSGTRSVYLDDLAVTVPATPARTWSYGDIHGDVTATADNSGTRTWIGWFGPYGENPAGTTPANTAATGTSLGWHGAQERLSDRDIIHMGARPYVPGLGRFLAVDPLEGGCANDYMYVFGDPLNKSDLNGKGIFGSIGCFLKNNWQSGLGIGLGAAGIALSLGTATPLVLGAGIAASAAGSALSIRGVQNATVAGDSLGATFGIIGGVLGGYGLGASVLGAYELPAEFASIVKGVSLMVGGIGVTAGVGSLVPAVIQPKQHGC